MKYLVVFGETGRYGKVVVSAPRGDYKKIISKALDTGAGMRAVYDIVERAYDTARRKGDKLAKNTDMISWAKAVYNLTWMEDRQEFIDISDVLFRPVPPNTKLGNFEGTMPPKVRYKPKVRP